MSKKQNQPEKLITYIGADNVFFQNLKDYIAQKHSNLAVTFNKYFSVDEKEIQSFLVRFMEERPLIILIDLSKATQSLLHIARVWERQNFYRKIHIIGLLDYGQTREDLTQALSASLKCVHIKSSELEAVAYSILAFAFQDKFENHGFATAEVDEVINAYFLGKTVKVSSDFIDIESDYNLLPGQEVQVKNYWNANKILRSEFCQLEEQLTGQNYYSYNYYQKLRLLHVDPIEPKEDETDDEIKVRQQKRKELIEEAKFKLKKWVSSNIHDSSPKYFVTFVIDKFGTFFIDNKPTDQYQFIFRSQPFLNNPEKELEKLSPHFIAYNLENVSDEELEANADIAHTYNDTRTLQLIVKSLKSIYRKRFKPYIVVFNSKDYETDYLQKTLDYENIIAYGDELSIELTLQLIRILQTKLEPTFPRQTNSEIIIKKTSSQSFCEIQSSITMVACSEMDIYFNADFDIAPMTVLKVYSPFPMFVTVMPPPNGSSISSQFYGLIHGIGEEEKMELRKYVNSIFFRELNQEKEKDAEEVEMVKQQYLEQKQREEEERLAKEKEEKEKEEARKKGEEERAKALAEAEKSIMTDSSSEGDE